MRENEVEDASEQDCYLVIKYFNNSDNQSLNFKDFLQIIMPCDDNLLRADIAQRPNFKVPKNQKLGEKVEQELCCLLEKEIALNRILEEIR